MSVLQDLAVGRIKVTEAATLMGLGRRSRLLKKALATNLRPLFIGSDAIRRWCVRGGDNRTGELFSYVDLKARVRRDHPLRAIRTIVNEAPSALRSIRRLGGRRTAPTRIENRHRCLVGKQLGPCLKRHEEALVQRAQMEGRMSTQSASVDRSRWMPWRA
jgi:hypothetical protein